MLSRQSNGALGHNNATLCQARPHLPVIQQLGSHSGIYPSIFAATGSAGQTSFVGVVVRMGTMAHQQQHAGEAFGQGHRPQKPFRQIYPLRI